MKIFLVFELILFRRRQISNFREKLFKAWNNLVANEQKESGNIAGKENKIYGQSIEMH